MITLRGINLDKLNSITKYPSIPTYHTLGDRGILQQDHIDFSSFATVEATEKVDGTNSRIIMLINPSLPEGFQFVIGSREELLYARGDLIGNPSMGIVDALRNTAESIGRQMLQDFEEVDFDRNNFYTFYFETYGGKVGANAKNYTREGKVGWRLFDIVNTSVPEFLSLQEKEGSHIARWREEEQGQKFLDDVSLEAVAEHLGLTRVPVTKVNTQYLPNTIVEGSEFLKAFAQTTQVALDDTGLLKPEGIVVRSLDRSKIAKIRYEDYERTLKFLSKKG